MVKKILIVDDEKDLVEVLKVRLRTAGYEVIVAHDGHEGLEMAKKQSPDLIILDLMLPKIDGYSVCRMIKFDEKYFNIPILIFSARTNESDKILAKEVGADDYITKPYEPQTLMFKIKELLKE